MGNGVGDLKEYGIDNDVLEKFKDVPHDQVLKLFERYRGKNLCSNCRKDPSKDPKVRESASSKHGGPPTSKCTQDSQDSTKSQNSKILRSHGQTESDQDTQRNSKWSWSFLSNRKAQAYYTQCRECGVEFQIKGKDQSDKCEK